MVNVVKLVVWGDVQTMFVPESMKHTMQGADNKEETNNASVRAAVFQKTVIVSD
jgi:hypothetical protein